jgi:hypothetical protein
MNEGTEMLEEFEDVADLFGEEFALTAQHYIVNILKKQVRMGTRT